MKKRFLIVLLLFSLFVLVSCKTSNNSNELPEVRDGIDGVDGKDGKDGKDGHTPYIGENGNWWIDGTDTSVNATIDDEKEVNNDILIGFDETKLNTYLNILNNTSPYYKITRSGVVSSENDEADETTVVNVDYKESYWFANRIKVFNTNHILSIDYGDVNNFKKQETDGTLYLYNNEYYFDGTSTGETNDTEVSGNYALLPLANYNLELGKYLLNDYEDYEFTTSLTLSNKGTSLLNDIVFNILSFHQSGHLVDDLRYFKDFKMTENKLDNTFKMSLTINKNQLYMLSEEFLLDIFDLKLENINDFEFNLLINFKNNTVLNIEGSLVLDALSDISGFDSLIIDDESFLIEFLFDLPDIPNFNDFVSSDLKDYIIE